MMNKRFFHPATVFFLLALAVGLLSWLGSIFGWPNVRSLLNAEGMRWILRNALPSYVSAPWLGSILVLAFGTGICAHSGWWETTVKILSRAQKLPKKYTQAWEVSLVIGGVWSMLCLVAVFEPGEALRSINGEWEGSPLSDGISWVCACGIGLMGIAFGYVSDHYRTDKDVVAGLSYFIHRSPSVMVTLFFVSQFFSLLRYTGLCQCLNLSETSFGWIYKAAVVLSFFIG